MSSKIQRENGGGRQRQNGKEDWTHSEVIMDHKPDEKKKKWR